MTLLLLHDSFVKMIAIVPLLPNSELLAGIFGILIVEPSLRSRLASSGCVESKPLSWCLVSDSTLVCYGDFLQYSNQWL